MNLKNFRKYHSIAKLEQNDVPEEYVCPFLCKELWSTTGTIHAIR
jgi:hypothetical protein